MGRVEALAMSEVRLTRRCWLSVRGVDEVIVVWTGGDMYVVGTVLDDWFVVPEAALRRFLAKLLNASEEDITLKC